MTAVRLAERLGTSEKALKCNKNREDFQRWSAKRDPEGRGWQWDGEVFSAVKK